MSTRWWLFTAGIIATVVAIGLILEVQYDPSLQEWSYLATAFAAVSTTVLVAVAVAQMSAIAQQLELNRSAVGAAVQSAAAAAQTAAATERTVREARHGRADEQAPRIITWLEEPAWPPYIDQTYGVFPGQEIFASAVQARWVQINPRREFVFPQDARELVWFLTRGTLINEGRGTARVRVDGAVRFLTPANVPLKLSQRLVVPPALAASGQRTFLMEPGNVAVFEWADGYPLREWADKAQEPVPALCTMRVYCSDFTEHMVQDVTRVELGARPVERVPQRDGGWRLVSRQSGDLVVGTTVYPTERTYRSEEAAGAG